MKKIFCAALVLISFSFSKAPIASNTEEATIYIYRDGQFMSAGANWSMFVDEKKVCKLSNNKFIKVTVSKGKHVISSKIGGVGLLKKETELELEVKAGKSYYVACNVKQSITRTRLELMEVTKSTAEKQMKDMSLDNCQETVEEPKK